MRYLFMDQTQKPTNDQIAENTDLSKQYQDILNQYSKELQGDTSKDSSQDPTATPEPEVVATAQTPIETPAPTPPMETEPVTPLPPVSPSASPVPPTPVVPTSLPPVPPMVGASSMSPPSPSPQSTSQPKSIFKYFFFLSLLVFLGVFGTIVYTVISTSANPTRITMETPSPTPSLADENGEDTGKYCEANDKKIPQGDSFTAADGCNTCTCGDDLTISCTEKDCSATPSASTSTPSSSPTSTEVSVADPIKSIIDSINKQLKTSYKATTLDKGKRWTVNLSKSSSKTNIIAIKKSITDYGLSFQEDLSGEAGTDWKETYVKNSDTCTLEMMQGVLTLACFN